MVILPAERLEGDDLNSRTILRATMMLLAGAICALGDAAAAENQTRPNILVIVADDLGYADLGVHGCTDIPTPHIDSLAKHGVRCTNGYVSGPYCSPTRAALLTGRYQQRFGHEFNGHDDPRLGMAVTEKTIADRLKPAGYATGIVGKWHLGELDPFHPLSRGFDEFFGFLSGAHSYVATRDGRWGSIVRGREEAPLDGYLTDVFGREAVAFIEQHRLEPFFLYLAFNAVHTPMQAPNHYVDRFPDIADQTRRTYAAMLSAMDDAVGTVLAKLRETGLEENTLVFFLSDNGGPTNKYAVNGSRNGPLRGSKGDTWEGGVRVPFFVQWTGRLPAGKTYDQPVIQLDILPTVLAAAGVEAQPQWKLDGVNLLPYLAGNTHRAPHDALYWRFGEHMAIRKGDWKVVKTWDTPAPQLFNLAADLGEKENLAAKHPEKLRELLAAWEKWNAELVPPAWPRPDGEKISSTTRVTAINPRPDAIPTLSVWEDGELSRDRSLTMVSASFPNVPNFTCDSWCYESELDFIAARAIAGGRLELRHRVRDQPHIVLVTTVSPEPAAVEVAARVELENGGGDNLPMNLPTPNICWQLRRAPGFASAPDPYPEFINRCFIFTESGRTFLDKTIRRKIPVRAADDRYNNPPWVQMYVGAWQDVPQAGPNSWADYSPTRYVATVIGTVSRDGKHLAALANDSATTMAQAWHDCMHNNPQWLPAEAPPEKRTWRVKIYAMENDPSALLARVIEDFPDARPR